MVRKFSGEENLKMCQRLVAEDGWRGCDEASFRADVCDRLRVAPEIRPALDDPQVRSAFNCPLVEGGAL